MYDKLPQRVRLSTVVPGRVISTSHVVHTPKKHKGEEGWTEGRSLL